MRETCSTNGKNEDIYKTFWSKISRQKTNRSRRKKWNDNIKIDFGEKGGNCELGLMNLGWVQ